jgi:hypothetical protein
MPTTAQDVPTNKPAMMRPALARMQLTHKFHCRSPILAEIQPQAIILIAPQM